MPIELTPFQSGDLCQGHAWTIADEDLLAQVVAKILMGKLKHVERILSSVGGPAVSFSDNVIADAISKLTLDDGEAPYHRDGLIFQILSWIAAYKSKTRSSILRAPHLVMAQKGFDGLQINIDNGEVYSVIVFEDKATNTPRKFVREKVWPEFIEFYEGCRESELQQEVSVLLDTRPDMIDDVEGAIEKIFWDQARQFRVAITAKKKHMTIKGRARLFKGYDKVIPDCSVEFRNAECVHLPNLRSWMQHISELAIYHINSYSGGSNV